MFTRAPYLWYKADVDVAEVLPLHLELELSEGFDEWHALYVAYCASQLLTQNTSSHHSTALSHRSYYSVAYITLIYPQQVQNPVGCTKPITLSALLSGLDLCHKKVPLGTG